MLYLRILNDILECKVCVGDRCKGVGANLIKIEWSEWMDAFIVA